MDRVVLDITDRTRFFVDDTAISAQSGLERRLHPLVKHPNNPIVRCTEPYEGGFLTPISVLFDEEARQWKLWYVNYGRRQIAVPGDRGSTLHLATSADGVHWEKPALGAFSLNGDRSNNITVFEDGSPATGGCAVFHDPADPDPSHRYKMIYYLPNYYLAYSRDGVTWRPAQKDPVWPNGSGDGLEETYFFLRDELIGKYRGYMRVWRRHQTIRTLSLGESDDLIHWTGPRIIWTAGPEFPPGTQIYGMLVWIDGGLYWGLPWMFYTDEPLDPDLRQTMRFKLAWSRDGREWHWLQPDWDVLPMGGPDEFDRGMVLSSCPMVRLEDRLRLYYYGDNVRHNMDGGRSSVGLAEIRRGGFVSLHADDEGWLLTHRFLFRGEELRINATTERDGLVAAELLNDSGAIMEAFTLERFDAFCGDAVDHVLSWRGRSDLRFLRGQNVMLRLKLREADLYSYRVAGRKELFTARLGPPPVRCGRCVRPPLIDGSLRDECWQDFSHSGVADDFVRFDENVPAPVKTRALLTWDDRCLYIAVECEEPATDRLGAGPGTEPIDYQKNDLVEFRFRAPQQGTFFNQLMVTVAGERQHCWFSVEEGGCRIYDRIDWEAKTAMIPGHWFIEMAVPFASLNTPTPKPGEEWKMNIIRYRYAEGRDVSCWSCMFGAVHRNDRSGTLVFV